MKQTLLRTQIVAVPLETVTATILNDMQSEDKPLAAILAAENSGEDSGKDTE